LLVVAVQAGTRAVSHLLALVVEALVGCWNPTIFSLRQVPTPSPLVAVVQLLLPKVVPVQIHQ
jgi:hypothetical protein